MTPETLGMIGGIIGVIGFLFTIFSKGRDNGAQLARIEANGLNVNQSLVQIKGEIAEMRTDQNVSKTFRAKYEEVIKDTAKLSKENEKQVDDIKRSIESIEEHLDKLDTKFDKMMEVFNAKINID